jgi:HemY protein
LIDYATQLETQNAGAEAEKLIRKAILSKWDPKLVLAYGEMTRCDAELQLRNATSWLRGHEHDARLLLTLGRLARRNHLWDKARGYLEESVKIAPSPDACQELGSLLEQLDEPESAKLSYRRGLQLLTGKVVASTTPVLEAPADDTKSKPAADEAKSTAEPETAAAKSG